MKTLISILLVTGFILAGCATSKMTSTRTSPDGTVTKYDVRVSLIGQDLAGTDLAASLNPEGETTIKAGAVNTTTSQVTADVTANFVEIVKLLLQYQIAPVAPVP